MLRDWRARAGCLAAVASARRAIRPFEEGLKQSGRAREEAPAPHPLLLHVLPPGC
jgi:hypothetical protein